MKEYIPREVDGILSRKLRGAGGVLIQGPKWCGKTTTANQQAGSAMYLADPENRKLAMMSYSGILGGETPRLIDEWQIVPQLWDAARHLIDKRDEAGQFIFTGSAVPPDMSAINHSGAGRFSWLTMRTMSLYESGDSNGEVSLGALFEGEEKVEGENKLGLDRIAYLICRGGWPGIIRVSESDSEIALDRAKDYLQAIVSTDISRTDGVSRNPLRTMRLLRSLARHQGDQVSVNGLREDLQQNEGDTLSTDTIVSYLNALSAIFVTEDAKSWNPNLRSKTAIRSAETRYFSDPSIAAAALGFGPSDLLSDLNTMGLVFETMAIRDLRVHASVLGGDVFHYRDKTGLECDAVIHLSNGRYGLIEIKLGGEAAEEQGVRTLKKLSMRLDTDHMREPSFMMVLTATGRYAYRRPDGVMIVPIGCLKS